MIKNQFFCDSKHWPRRINKIKKIFNKTIKLKDLGFKKKYNYFLNLVLTNDKEINAIRMKPLVIIQVFKAGLNTENIKSLLKNFSPYGIDTSSGVETNGIKDLKKIKRFIELAKN